MSIESHLHTVYRNPGVDKTHMLPSPVIFSTANKIKDLRTGSYIYYTGIHLWQSRVENERYSVAYFDRIRMFKVLYL